jgi:hypothetical protein
MHVIRIAVASAGLLSFTLSSQAADTTPMVIPAGNTAALGSSVGPMQDTPQAKILSEALSKDTRATLQQAMNSSAN